MNEISALIRRDMRELAFFPFCYLPHKDICKPGKGFSPDTKYDSTLILDFLFSRTMRNKCLFVKPRRLWCSDIAVQTKVSSLVKACDVRSMM